MCHLQICGNSCHSQIITSGDISYPPGSARDDLVMATNSHSFYVTLVGPEV